MPRNRSTTFELQLGVPIGNKGDPAVERRISINEISAGSFESSYAGTTEELLAVKGLVDRLTERLAGTQAAPER